MLDLADLPNENGFRFVGVTKSGDRLPCMVLFDHHAGIFRAYDNGTGEPIFNSLKGWERDES